MNEEKFVCMFKLLVYSTMLNIVCWCFLFSHVLPRSYPPPSYALHFLPTFSLQQENPEGLNRIKAIRDGGRILTDTQSDRARDNNPGTTPKLPMVPNSLRTLQERLLQTVKGGDSNFSKTTVSVTTQTATTVERESRVTQETKSIPSLMPMLLPARLANCNIDSKKDALSAISRARTDECKSLIHNVTCLSQDGSLYNTEIKNTCPIGRDPGKNFQHRPHAWGVGPPAR